MFTTITTAYPYRLRGAGNQQATTGLLFTPPSISQPGTSTTVLLNGLAMGYVRLFNGSGSNDLIVGAGFRLANGFWVAGPWDDDAATPFTDDTADAQDLGTGDFELESLVANDGFVIASPIRFNAVSIDVGTASGGNPARTLRYSNSAGTGWSALSNPLIFDAQGNNYAVTGTTDANEFLIVYNTPLDWGKTQASGLSGIPGGMYALNVRSTTAPGAPGVADAIEVFVLHFLEEDVDNNETVERNPALGSVVMREANGAVALFSTAHAENAVTIQTCPRG